MAELVLTETEVADAEYLDWSDETLGKNVRCMAHKLIEHERNQPNNPTVGPTISLAAGLVLIAEPRRIGASEFRMVLNGVTNQGRPDGDWLIRAERVSADSDAESGLSDREVRMLSMLAELDGLLGADCESGNRGHELVETIAMEIRDVDD